MSEMKRVYETTAEAVEQFRRGITETCRADNYRIMSDMLRRKAIKRMDDALHEILHAMCMDDSRDPDVWAVLLDTETPVDEMVARLFDMRTVTQ